MAIHTLQTTELDLHDDPPGERQKMKLLIIAAVMVFLSAGVNCQTTEQLSCFSFKLGNTETVQQLTSECDGILSISIEDFLMVSKSENSRSVRHCMWTTI